MRRGFKTEANAIAREVRAELSLSRTSPLDVWLLTEHLDIPAIPLSSFHRTAPQAARLFLNGAQEMFSGVTVFRGPRRTIVFNDAHALGRQANDVGHELSHGLLLHTPDRSKLRRKVPRVEGALAVKPSTRAVLPARSTSAASMQSPPARAEATRVIILSPVFARPGAPPGDRALLVDEMVSFSENYGRQTIEADLMEW